jgi:hypothetical protein
MIETPPRPSRLRRLLVLAAILFVLAQLALVLASSAEAICTGDQCGPGGDPTPTWTSQLTVTAPSTGTIYGQNAAGVDVIHCSASDATCSVTDVRQADTRDLADWPTYVLRWEGAAGYQAIWPAFCSATGAPGTCPVLNDQASATVSATIVDRAAPSPVSLYAPARSGPATTMTASASDNSGTIKEFSWRLCPGTSSSHGPCTVYATTTTGASSRFTMPYSLARGSYVVTVWVEDPSGNVSTITGQTYFVPSLLMTWTTVPAYTENPVITFHSDDEANVPDDAAHRQCRAWISGTYPFPAFGPCTTATSYAPSVTENDWTLQVQETDDVGATGTITVNTTVDRTSPALAFTDDVADGATVSTPTSEARFSASDLHLDTVTCALDGAAPTACASPYELSGYRAGNHTLTVTARDLAGHTATVTRHFVADLPLSVTLDAPSRVRPDTAITATATDLGGTVTDYAWSLCTTAGTCTPYRSGATLDSIALGDVPAGTHVVKVAVSDDDGRTTTKTATTTLVTAVHLTTSRPAAYTESPSVTFASDDPSHVVTSQCRAYPTGSTPTGDEWSPCSGTFAPALPDGAWTLQEQVVDDLDLVATATQKTVVDTVAPTLELTSGPAEGTTVTTSAVGVGFTASDTNLATTTCSLDGRAAVVCASPYTVTGYRNGEHTLTVRATDRAGHRTTSVRHFAALVRTMLRPRPATVTSTYGRAARLAVTVAPSSATGTVRFLTSRGARLCTATVRAGIAQCVTPRSLAAGRRGVTASYTGGFSASHTTLVLVVRKAATAVKATAAQRVRRGAHVVIAVGNLPRAATGTVQVLRLGHRQCSARVVRGVARCTITAPRKVGRYAYTVRYSGSANFAASSSTLRLTVVR